MSLSWAHKRQLLFGSIVFVVVAGISSSYIYFTFFNKTPTCFDRKQNGNEQGVDCGGVCTLACTNQVMAEPVKLWSRPFVVAHGVANLVAYMQNPNVGYIGQPASYIFRVYDKDNVLIGVREGSAYIPQAKEFAIFEPGFNTGELEPVRAIFEFTEPIYWLRAKSGKTEFVVNNINTTGVAVSPRVDAKIENKTINRYKNIEVVALVYDSEDNAIAASRTIVDDLPGGAIENVTFTWPEPFTSPEARVEIIPKVPVKIN